MSHRIVRAVGAGLLAIVLAGGARAAPAGDPEPAKALLRQAYLAVVEAESARTSGRPAEALAGYRRALALYDDLVAKYPDWQGELISYRSADCHNQIADLERTLAGGAPDSATNAVPAPPATNAEARLVALLDELRQARDLLAAAVRPAGRGAAAGRAPEAATPDVRALEDECDALRKANRDLQEESARLQAKLDRAQQKKRGGRDVASALQLCASVLRVEGRRLIRAGERDAAVALLEEACRLFPGDADMAVLLGSAYCAAGRYADAVALLKPVAREARTNATVYLVLGSAHVGEGALGPARVAMEEAVRLAPASPEANYNLAQLLMALTPPEAVAASQYYLRSLNAGGQQDPELEAGLRNAAILQQLRTRKK
jgi:tetratricopeptide (TPR) repeat protein